MDEAVGAETEAADAYRIRRIVTPTWGNRSDSCHLWLHKPPSIAYRSRKRATLVPISKMSDKTGTGALAASCWRHQQLREPRGVKEHARTKCGTPSQTPTKPNRSYGREGDESLSRVRRAAGSSYFSQNSRHAGERSEMKSHQALKPKSEDLADPFREK